MERSKIFLVAGAGSILLIVAVVIISIFNLPQNMALRYALKRGAKHPEIVSKEVLSDSDMNITLLGVSDEFENGKYKKSFPKCIKYTIKSDNFPEYHIYYYKCHTASVSTSISSSTDPFSVSDYKEYMKKEEKTKFKTAKGCVDDLYQVYFKTSFVENYEELILENGKYSMEISTEEDIDRAKEIQKELFKFLNDLNVKQVNTKDIISLKATTFFTINFCPAEKSEKIVPKTYDVTESTFFKMGSNTEDSILLHFNSLLKNNYEIKNGLLYIKEDKKAY